MSALFDLSLYSGASLLGLIWTLAVIAMLYLPQGVAISSSRWLLPFTLAGVVIAIPMVAADVAQITLLAGGITTLDAHVGYRPSDMLAFAQALGDAGRRDYAFFQLGMDSLAPPAFAGFVLNVGRSTLSAAQRGRWLTILVSAYFFSVLLANTLMPVFMLNFPSEGMLAAGLVHLLPVLDGIKYAVHALLWVTILSIWLIRLMKSRA